MVRGPPIATRAWVFQEHLLAPRNLLFGDSQIHWECCHATLSEQHPDTNRTSTWLGWKDQKIFFETMIENGFDESHINTVQVIMAWNHFVTTYSGLQLTKATDRLAALAGIAQVLEKRYPLTYVSGMWKEQIPHNLTWYAWNPTQKLPLSTIPSWSWTSMVNPRFGVSLFSISPDIPTKELRSCEFMPFHSRMTSSVIMGRTKGDYLLLRGLLIPAVVGAQPDYGAFQWVTVQNEAGSFNFRIVTDECVRPQERVYLFLVNSCFYTDNKDASFVHAKDNVLRSLPVSFAVAAGTSISVRDKTAICSDPTKVLPKKT